MAQNRQKLARPSSPRARRPHPGRNLGLGRQCRAGALARLGRGLAHPISTIRLDPTAERAFRSDKTPTPRAPEETLTSFSSALSLSSPHSALSSQRSRSQPPSERARATTVERKPWRRRRPPRRRACYPTGEHAAVERPGYGALLLLRRRKVFPTPGVFFLFSFFPVPFFPIPTHGN